MKKILLIMLLVFSALLFVGCDIDQASALNHDDKKNTEEDTNKDKTDEYKLIVNDDFGIILTELDNSYKSGEELEIKTRFFSGLRAQVFLDGEELKSTSSEAWKYEAFIITMPNHDATLQTTINGFPKPQEKCNEHKYENGHCIYCGIKEVKDNTSNYNKFIDLDSSCGLDLFVYNDNGIDKCVLFSHKIIKAESCGTVIYTLLQIIQDSLDNYSLSIDEMKEVLKTYEEDDLHYILIHIVDEKINYDDLNYYYSYSVDGEKLEKRTEVANKLGLDISSELKRVLLKPVFSSGVIYAKVGSTLDISFDLSPTDYAYKNVYIKSSNESVVTIDNTGKASFISEGGAQIIFSVDGILAYYPVSVSNEDVEKITLPDEIKSINPDDLVAMDGFHSMISSFIFFSKNEDLLKYVLNLSLSIDYTEILTDENRDPVAENQDKYVSIQLTNNRLLRLTLTTESNIYLQYLEKVGGDFVVKYQFKAYKPEQYNALTVFCQMGMPQNHWWCETPACTKYYTGDYPIDEYKQETIVKTFIDHKSPLSDFYKNGTKFSGFIRKSFGKFNGYYAVIVDGCGLYYTECEEEVTIDGVKFTYSDGNQMYLICAGGVLSLQEAFEKEIINHDDLIEISKRLNGNNEENINNQEEQTNAINSLFVDKYYFGMLLYVQPNLLSTREDTSMNFQDGELVIGSNKYKLEEKTFDDHFIKIDDAKLNDLFSFPTKGLIARIDDGIYYYIIEGDDGKVYCLECAAINSEFYECDILCAYLLVKKIRLDPSFMYRTVDDKCDSKNIAEASKVNLIQVDMTFEEVVEILGKPVASLGSGAIWYEWNLNDGTQLQIHFSPKDTQNLYVLRVERKYNFTNDSVLVVVKKEYSGINKEWSLDFFGDLPIKEVKDLTHRDNPDSVSNPDEWRQILEIKLKEPSYEGVLELIEELKKFDEFEYVGPNYIIYLE